MPARGQATVSCVGSTGGTALASRTSKLVSLSEAAQIVRDGARIAVGGFAIYQHPMAFVRELLRQGRKDLTVVGVANGIEVDLLAGAGGLSVIETSYVGLENYGLARNFRRAVEQGRLKVVDYPELTSWDRFRASQENLTFWPVGFLGGSDIVRHNSAIKAFACPLTGRRLFAVPPADPEVVVICAAAGDRYGNVLVPARRLIPQSLDITLARSCDTVIVTVEKLVETAFIRRHAHLNQIPSYRTTCIVEVPWGAHPTPVLGVSRTDHEHFLAYTEASGSQESFAAYLDTYVYGPRDHMDYLERVGLERLVHLREQDALS
jgi:glutaconate CoA-transferase subunit A